MSLSHLDAKLATAIIIICMLLGGMVGLVARQSSNLQISEEIPYVRDLNPLENLPVPIRTFADYEDLEVNYMPRSLKYSVESNLSNVLNIDDYPWYMLSTEALQKLEKNFFLAVPNYANIQFSDVYMANYDKRIPSFVTVDSVLHAFHVIYDTAMRMIEEHYFIDTLGNLSLHMVEVSLRQFLELTEDSWKTAALKNAAFFSVVAKIINPSWKIPLLVKKWAEKMLDLINNASGFSNDWFMNQLEDFSQYRPRGHYTASAALQRYFRAMMVLGRISFRLKPADYWLSIEQNIERGHNETSQGILMSLALYDHSTVFPHNHLAVKAWSHIYDTTSFFVGKSDDLSPHEYYWLAKSIYDRNLYDITVLQNDELLTRFIEVAMTLRDPRILSSFHDQSTGVDFTIATKGMRFMGQRYVPDSYILGELVFDRVGNQTLPRTMPKGLDVMSAFGSTRAWELLQDQLKYENYESQMMKLREEFHNLTIETWSQNLYWLWLYALTPLLENVSRGCPVFMQSQAWQDKQVTSALGTWTELRHDTVLTGRQSYGFYYFGPQYIPPGYVEPTPDVYARLASLCQMMIDGLKSRSILNTSISDALESLKNLLLNLRNISIKELENIQLTSDELELLEYIGDTLSFLESLDYDIGDARVVVDVHTDVISEHVLQEATGNPMILYVIVPNQNGKPFLARGAMFSYYEFERPLDSRLTDKEWCELLESDHAPSMPNWMSSFVLGLEPTVQLLIESNEKSCISTALIFVSPIMAMSIRIDTKSKSYIRT